MSKCLSAMLLVIKKLFLGIRCDEPLKWEIVWFELNCTFWFWQPDKIHHTKGYSRLWSEIKAIESLIVRIAD